MDTIQLIDAALNRDLKHLSQVSQNVANVNTNGYMAVKSFDQVLMTQPQTHVLQHAAGIRDTGRSLDIAIVGDGFFRVLLDGNEYLTRNGHFHINSSGYLAHASGALVLGEQGPIVVQADGLSISPDGWLNQAGTPLTKLSISISAELKESRLGQGLYVSDLPGRQLETYAVKIAAVNTSNVNSSAESVRMMELSRHIQSLQKAAASYDQMLSSGINELGKK
ncbi:flagellar hook-basal body complex protein [Arsukibacterium perlucidum]|uniref:flagellar hook-basal body complex protein n=1 Tax=Arsukibacterium perlucidum TaxID=368811 RepID=UPI0003792295|nr:flagellar hook-basal body complex protein [Arsukibacterium perlucidum]